MWLSKQKELIKAILESKCKFIEKEMGAKMSKNQH